VGTADEDVEDGDDAEYIELEVEPEDDRRRAWLDALCRFFEAHRVEMLANGNVMQNPPDEPQAVREAIDRAKIAAYARAQRIFDSDLPDLED
jgi:hypothetical protein